MRRNIKKLLVGLACMSMMNVQSVMAYSGSVLTNDLGGANIVDHTPGLEKVTTDQSDAYLKFNADTIINWGKLNVGEGQSLNFLNGNHAVLNNVSGGMSTLSGSITAQNGMVLISNPNGMVMKGGTVDASGCNLILTSQDLTNLNLSQLGNLKFEDLKAELISGDRVALGVVALQDAKVDVANFGMLSDFDSASKKKMLNRSDITASGNIEFVTNDGANFVAFASKLKANDIKINSGGDVDVHDGCKFNMEVKADGTYDTLGTVEMVSRNHSHTEVREDVFDGGFHLFSSYFGETSAYSGTDFKADKCVFGALKAYTGVDLVVDSNGVASVVPITDVATDVPDTFVLQLRQCKVLGNAHLDSAYSNVIVMGYRDENYTKNPTYLDPSSPNYNPFAYDPADPYSSPYIGGDLYAASNSAGNGYTGLLHIGADINGNLVERVIVNGKVTTRATGDTYIFTRTINKDLELKDCYSGGGMYVNNVGGGVIADNVNGKPLDVVSEGTNKFINSTPDRSLENLTVDELNAEAERVLNSRNASMISSAMGGDEFTPVAFAANEEDAKRNKANGRSTVYKDQENVIHIVSRVNLQ